ncbi:MAG: glycosyltransferase [Simkaniaceae bacterium]|nr:glycosyltransferase [Simkaniaceae bacterium]
MMKKSFTYLFLFGLLATCYYGLKTHFGVIEKIAPQKCENSIQSRLEKIHPLLEDQMIAAVILAENHSADIERCLDSIFSQSYEYAQVILIDNGSTDGTKEKAKAFAKQRDKKLEVITYDETRPNLEVLFDVIGMLDPHFIVCLIEGKDWLSHENVFDHLNCAFANEEVWVSTTRAISHPDYQTISGKMFSDKNFMEKEFRENVREKISPLLSFYAGLFQKIKLEDLLYKGEFIHEYYDLAISFSLFEMSPQHVLFMDEVCYVINEKDKAATHKMQLQKNAEVDAHLRSNRPYETLSQLKLDLTSPSFHRYKTDVIVFSDDSPLQLYAYLESLHINARDINDVYVIYRASDQDFQRAYLNLQGEFHTITFLNVCDYPGNDYGSLISKAISNRRHGSPYVVIGDDSAIFEERIRFHECIAALERVHSDHFFLRDPANQVSAKHIKVSEDIFAYQLGENGISRGFGHALCRKSLFNLPGELNDLSAFQKYWESKLHSKSVGLCFNSEKVHPIDEGKPASLSQRKQWGHQFIEGYKIDLSSLRCEDETGEIPLIKRDRRHSFTHAD